MRPSFEPRLVNDCFGDPGLYVELRDEKRALLFDLGDLSALPPRKLLRLSEVFVTHTHVDHFVGFDHLLRVILGRKKRLTLIGGPGFIDSVEHKLHAYTWNVVHRYEVPLELDVREIDSGGTGRRALFSSAKCFARVPVEAGPLGGDVVLAEETFRVRARFVDHDIACLAFVLEEAAHVNIWKNRLAQWGLPTGPWLQDLKRAVRAGAADDTPIPVHWRDRHGEHAATPMLGELRAGAFEVVPGTRIGYVTDLRYSAPNVRTLCELLSGVDQLFIESVFLDADVAHATRKNHLTARQAGSIARAVGARAVLPFHFSPRYEGRDAELLAEIDAACKGELAAAPLPSDDA